MRSRRTGQRRERSRTRFQGQSTFRCRAPGQHNATGSSSTTADVVSQDARFWEQNGSDHRRAGGPKHGDRSRMNACDQRRRHPSDHPSARALCCGPGRREFESLTGPTRACRLLYSSEIQQPRRATAILGTHQHTCWAAPLNASRAAPVVTDQKAGVRVPPSAPEFLQVSVTY
jgi:hypothetical protein